MKNLPKPWRIVRDQQKDGTHFRNLVVVGPGIMKDERKYWLAFNIKQNKFKETECLRYMRRQDSQIVRAIGRVVRSTQPAVIEDREFYTMDAYEAGWR
ncbi:hypothetical protein R0135_00565 [Congregibacter variabilis]|uniref:Uncharacterized protein n=1 Tax=Congregibacter variabilis TaxID=3081200 RepID=A0ABZ0I6I8_9GAMM|nr:hypothetical protein R0135_00565 [Congregibacter sp. IMCC43200]